MNWRQWLGLELTPKRFAHRVGKFLQETTALSPVLDLENFRFVTGEGRYVNLHNVYREYKSASAKERADVLANFVNAMLNPPAVPDTFEEVKPLLLPVLRRSTLIDDALRQTRHAKPGAGAIAHRDFGPDVVLALVIDSPRAMSMVMAPQLKEWGVTFEMALAVALDNLRNRSVDNFSAAEGIPGLTCGNWRDAYDSSRVLFPDLLFRGVSSGNPIVMVPTRDTLLLAQDNNIAAQLGMLALADQALRESQRWCSIAMYQVVNGKLEVVEPQDEKVRDVLQEMQREIAMSDYANQKPALEADHASDGKDIFVASFSKMTLEARVVSYCAWTENVTAMLPKTDFVALVRSRNDGESDFVLADWDTLAERHGDLMQELGIHPPRYLVSAFPKTLFDEMLAATQDEAA